MADSARPGKMLLLLRRRNPPMENETRECTIKECLSWLAGWLWPWLVVSSDDGERIGCPKEIVRACGVWLSGACVDGGSSVNAESSPVLDIAEKGCTPSMNCEPRGWICAWGAVMYWKRVDWVVIGHHQRGIPEEKSGSPIHASGDIGNRGGGSEWKK